MKILIVGGGAAGFFAAITCREYNPHATIVIAEKSKHLLSKVRISGGGRCNVTNQPVAVSDFATNYPRGQKWMQKILHHFGPQDIIRWFESHDVPLKTEPDGRVFPVSDSSQSIIDCLLRQSVKSDIEIRLNTSFSDVHYEKSALPRQFDVQWANGTSELFDAIIIACGGFPSIRSYEWLLRKGIEYTSPVPSLFTFNSPENPICQLMGVAVPEAKVKIVGTKLADSGPLLITHWGFSGPAILRLSAWGAQELFSLGYHFSITIQWTGSMPVDEVKKVLFDMRDKKIKQTVVNRSHFNLPARLWKYHVNRAGISDIKSWADLSNKELGALLNELTQQNHAIKGKTTFKEEFVTAGGVKLSAIEHQTMQSKQVPGMFFAGEFIDVDGITGGFNFQNAWTTGFLAGKHAGLSTNPTDPK